MKQNFTKTAFFDWHWYIRRTEKSEAHNQTQREKPRVSSPLMACLLHSKRGRKHVQLAAPVRNNSQILVPKLSIHAQTTSVNAQSVHTISRAQKTWIT